MWVCACIHTDMEWMAQTRRSTTINRYQLPYPGLAHALPPGTVLDGELVYNRLSRSYVFLVFDVLFWGNEALMQVGVAG